MIQSPETIETTVSGNNLWAPDAQQVAEMRAANRRFYANYYRRRLFLGLRYEYIYRKRLLKDFLAKLAIPRSRQKVLDVGFGNGDLLFMFDRSCELHGLEISSSAVELAREQARKRGYKNCTLIEHDLHDLIPYPDESFDLVICSHVLEHVENDEEVLTDLHRVLKTHGYLFVLIPINEERVYARGAKHIQKYTAESFRQTAERCGFHVLYAIEHLFFDRPFKAFAPFARRYPPLDLLRRAVQHTLGFVVVYSICRPIEHLLRMLGCRATALCLVLQKKRIDWKGGRNG